MVLLNRFIMVLMLSQQTYGVATLAICRFALDMNATTILLYCHAYRYANYHVVLPHIRKSDAFCALGYWTCSV